MKKKNIALGLGAVTAAVASFVTLGMIKKKKNKSKEKENKNN